MKISFLSACLFLAYFATAQSGTSTVKWLTHKDSLYNLSIQYPSNWQLKPPNENARFFITSYPESAADNFRENLNCIVPSPVKKGVTLKAAEEDINNTLSGSLPGFELVHSGYSSWNGVNSYEIEYVCTQTSGENTYELHMLQKIMILKGKLYALTFTSLTDSYDKYIGDIRKMIQSFRVH